MYIMTALKKDEGFVVCLVCYIDSIGSPFREDNIKCVVGILVDGMPAELRVKLPL